MTARKQLTLKQAEAEMSKHQDTYRKYVAAQSEKKNAKTKTEEAAAQKKMDSLRNGYTAYRTAYRDFGAQGGKKRTGTTQTAAQKKAAAKKKADEKKAAAKAKADKKKADAAAKASNGVRTGKRNADGSTSYDDGSTLPPPQMQP